MKKLIFALVLAIIFTLSACDRDASPVPEQTLDTVPTEKPTEPVVDPIQIYRDAADFMQSSENLSIHASISKDIYVGDQTFSEYTTYDLGYSVLDQELFSGKVVGEVEILLNVAI